MHKDIFYRCLREIDGTIIAQKTFGFSEGDIGLNEINGMWEATHIPTGMKLSPNIPQYKTAKAALSNTEKRIADNANFKKLIEQCMESNHYRAFCKSRYEQSITSDFERRLFMNTILQFNFETGDASCAYYQVYVIVNSDDFIDYDTLEDSISSYMDSNYDEDNEYEDIVEDIMNASDLSWIFMGKIIPESRTIYSYWI